MRTEFLSLRQGEELDRSWEERFMNTTTAAEVERLRAAEAEADDRRGVAIKHGDLFAARNAAHDWLKASDALSEYVTAHYRPLSR
jgi:hypothetical protein